MDCGYAIALKVLLRGLCAHSPNNVIFLLLAASIQSI